MKLPPVILPNQQEHLGTWPLHKVQGSALSREAKSIFFRFVYLTSSADIAGADKRGNKTVCCWARCQDPHDLATLRVTRTLPADLNSFLFAMERDLAAFAEVSCHVLWNAI